MRGPHLPIVFILASSLPTACFFGTDDKPDDSGETDTGASDLDGDGLTFEEELGLGTDPTMADSDSDGLEDGEEADHGTDPLVDDTDGDTYLDGDEVDAGTNPMYEYSHTYTGGYNVGYCDVPPVPTGPTGACSFQHGGSTYNWTCYQVGDVVENFSLMDQHGEYVDLYSFCGQHIVLTSGAFW